MPQGSILGPILFLLYINDFCQAVNSGSQILFADDATYYESDHSYEILLNRVNSNLVLIHEWFIANRLSINIVKTESMLFCRNLVYFPMSPVILNGIEIGFSYTLKFLGLQVDFKLNWKTHIFKVRNKLSQACGVMYQLRNKLTPTIARMIYMTLVLPYLNYCNVIWTSCSPSYLQPLVATQKKFIRIMTKSRRLAPTLPLFIRLKILKLKDLNELNTAIFVFKSLYGIIPSPIEYQERILEPYNLRNVNPLVVPFSRSSQTQRFVHSRGATLWNSLPIHLRSARTLLTFKRKLKQSYLDSYFEENA